jgi:hypothetical protein
MGKVGSKLIARTTTATSNRQTTVGFVKPLDPCHCFSLRTRRREWPSWKKGRKWVLGLEGLDEADMQVTD